MDSDFYAQLATDVLTNRSRHAGPSLRDRFERDRCASDAACYALAAAGLIDFEELTARMFAQESALLDRHGFKP
jgi:hypothetical protein